MQKKPCTFNWREIGYLNPNNRLISKTALLLFLFLGLFSIQYVIQRSKVAKIIFKNNENEMLWRDETKAEKLHFSQNVECILVSVIMKRKIRKRKVTWEPTWEQMPKLNSCIIRLGSPPTRQKFAHPILTPRKCPPSRLPPPPTKFLSPHQKSIHPTAK